MLRILPVLPLAVNSKMSTDEIANGIKCKCSGELKLQLSSFKDECTRVDNDH